MARYKTIDELPEEAQPIADSICSLMNGMTLTLDHIESNFGMHAMFFKSLDGSEKPRIISFHVAIKPSPEP